MEALDELFQETADHCRPTRLFGRRAQDDLYEVGVGAILPGDDLLRQ